MEAVAETRTRSAAFHTQHSWSPMASPPVKAPFSYFRLFSVACQHLPSPPPALSQHCTPVPASPDTTPSSCQLRMPLTPGSAVATGSACYQPAGRAGSDFGDVSAHGSVPWINGYSQNDFIRLFAQAVGTVSTCPQKGNSSIGTENHYQWNSQMPVLQAGLFFFFQFFKVYLFL